MNAFIRDADGLGGTNIKQHFQHYFTEGIVFTIYSGFYYPKIHFGPNITSKLAGKWSEITDLVSLTQFVNGLIFFPEILVGSGNTIINYGNSNL